MNIKYVRGVKDHISLILLLLSYNTIDELNYVMIMFKCN